MRRVALGYGRAPLMVSIPDDAEVIDPPQRALRGPMGPGSSLWAEALKNPVGAERLRGRFRRGARVVVVVSDGSRSEPRLSMIRALLEELGVEVRLTIAVANGTHAPGKLDELGIGELVERGAVVYNHASTDDRAFVDVGVTQRGTRVRFPGAIAESDLVIATGRIRPHYFAGFGAGAKAIFPGLGHNDDIRQNHQLKSDSTARLGRVDGNCCRLDLEEAAAMLPVESFLLNVVADCADRPVAAFAGDLVMAHRAAVSAYRPLCEVQAEPADVVVVSDHLPVTASLYQASKLLVPAGVLLRPGGVAILAAECPDGTGPLKVVNEGIYRIGIAHVFPREHLIFLVSHMSEETVLETYCRPAVSVESVLEEHVGKRVVILPRAGSVIPWTGNSAGT